MTTPPPPPDTEIQDIGNLEIDADAFLPPPPLISSSDTIEPTSPPPLLSSPNPLNSASDSSLNPPSMISQSSSTVSLTSSSLDEESSLGPQAESHPHILSTDEPSQVEYDYQEDDSEEHNKPDKEISIERMLATRPLSHGDIPKLYSMKANIFNLSALGPGVEILFQLLLGTPILLLAFFLISLWPTIQAFKDGTNSELSGLAAFSVGHIAQRDELSPVYGFWIVFMLLILLLWLYFSFAYSYLLAWNNDRYLKSNSLAADEFYSILVRKLPNNVSAEDVHKFFSHFGEIIHVSLIPEYRDLPWKTDSKIILEREIRWREIWRDQQDPNETSSFMNKFRGGLISLGQKLRIITILSNLQNQQEHFSENLHSLENEIGSNSSIVGAFVTFASRSDRNLCLRLFRKRFDDTLVTEVEGYKRLPGISKICCSPLWMCCVDEHLKFNGKVPKIQEAPSPTDFLWENAHVTGFQRFKLNFLTNFINILLLTGAAFLVFTVGLSRSSVQSIFVRSLLTLIIVIVNLFLTSIAKRFEKLEKHFSRTFAAGSTMIKLWAFQTVNTLLLLGLANVASCNQQFGFTECNNKYLYFNDVFSDATAVIFGELVLTNLVKVYDPKGRFFLWLYGESATTQWRLDTLYQLRSFNIAILFANCAKILTLVAFFGPMFPPIYFFGFLYFSFEYWVNKYFLIRLSRTPPVLSPLISRSFYFIIFVTAIAHLAGVVITMAIVANSQGPLIIMTLGILIFIAFILFRGIPGVKHIFLMLLDICGWCFKISKSQTGYSSLQFSHLEISQGRGSSTIRLKSNSTEKIKINRMSSYQQMATLGSQPYFCPPINPGVESLFPSLFHSQLNLSEDEVSQCRESTLRQRF